MALNISKTKVIYISSRHKQHIINTSDTDICYKNSTVSGNPNVEVTLTNKYSLLGYSYWKCSQKLQLIPFYVIQNENVHEYYKRKLFFNSYSITHLDYCSIIWGNYSDSSEDELFKFPKRAAMVILNKNPPAEHFTESQWMTFLERVLFQISTALSYKIYIK